MASLLPAIQLWHCGCFVFACRRSYPPSCFHEFTRLKAQNTLTHYGIAGHSDGQAFIISPLSDYARSMSNLLQLAEATQKAAQQVQNLDGFLKAYREVMGPVEDFRALCETGNSNLLTMRFAIMRNVRDDEVKKAKDLAKQLADNAKGLSSSQ